jgi:hypothetical protein
MREHRPLGRERLADVQGDARIAFAAVPVRPVAFEPEEGRWDLLDGGFDFLQADDVRTLAVDPVLDLRLPRPDAVNVPCREFQKRACAA